MADVLVLAGGALEKERFAGVDSSIARKVQIPLLGRPMVEWTVAAAAGCPEVRRIVVVGHESLRTPALRALGALVVPEQAGIAENLRAGLDALPESERVLALSGDLPLLTPAALTDLLERPPEADVVFPYVERADALRRFPDREWIFMQTPEGAFTGCSAAIIRPQAVRECWPWAEALLDARRKSVFGLAAMIGPAFALKYLLRRLRVADVEARFSSLLHLTARGYRTPHAELAMDVDKFTDIALVEQVLRDRANG